MEPTQRTNDVLRHKAPLWVRCRRQFNWWTRWWPEHLRTARGKALSLWAHSSLEGITNFNNAWQAWAAAHPDDPRSSQQPFTPEALARAEIVWLPPLQRRHHVTMAAIWDHLREGRLPCCGCWLRSPARRAMDYALADAMGWTRASMDEIAEQAVNAHRLLGSVGETLPPPAGCELPDHCSAVIGHGHAALDVLAA